MALDFLSLKDRQGVAIFLISDGMTRNQQGMTRLSEELTLKTNYQIIELSTGDSDAKKIFDFYDLKSGNHILLIGDTDELLHAWVGNELPNASQIAHIANQVG